MNHRLLSSLLLLGLLPLSACGGGGGGGSDPVVVSATLSTLEVDHDFGAPADGTARVRLTVTVRDEAGEPVSGRRVSLASTGSGNVLVQPPRSNADGVAVGTLASFVPEIKTITATIDPGPDEVVVANVVRTEFVRIPPLARYVTQDGDDASSGTSPIEAWRTLGHAASVLQPGETVFVGAGTYAESVDVLVSGTADLPITFQADVDGCYTGDAGRAIVDALGGAYGFRLDGRRFVLIRGFTVVGAAPGALPGGAFWVGGAASDDLVLSENEAYGNGRGFWIDQATDVVLEGNRVSNNLAGTGEGIVLGAVTGADVANNLVYNNGGSGLMLLAGAMDVNVRFNTFYANAGEQVFVSDSTTVARIGNNVISEGGAAGIRLPSPDSVDESQNLVWGHAGPDVESGGTGMPPDGVNADPQFIDPAGPDGLLGGAEGLDDDFTLDTASPAIDAGDAPAATTWLAVRGALSTTTDRSDLVADGTSPDGALANLGQHRPLAEDLMDPIASGAARLVWGQAGDVRLRARTWDDVGRAWGAARIGSPANQDVEWVIHRASPVGDYEIVAALADLGTGTDLVVRHWDGRKWNGEDPFDPIVSSIASGDSDQRGFDLEFEALSGQALLVTADGTSNPRYRVFENGRWSAESAVYPVAPATGRVLWVELVSRPGTDELALVTLTANQVLSAAIWDGDAWETAPTVLGTVITTTTISKAFDAAFESLSGDLVVIWGHTTFLEEARFAERSEATGAWRTGLIPAAEATTYVVRLAPEPGTNRIVGGFAEASADNDTVAFIWDGTIVGQIVEFDLDSGQNQRELGVGWVGTTGIAVVAYKDNDGGGTLSWGRFSNNLWRKMADLSLPGVGDQEFAQMRTYPDQNRLLLVLADDAGSLFGLDYDGTTWTFTNGGQALATGLELTNASARPFDFDFRR